MVFASIRIITNDIRRIVSFYEKIIKINAVWSTDLFAEIVTPSFTIAIGHSSALGLSKAGEVARPADNHSVIFEFLVGDVDAEWERIKTLVGDVIQEPTTLPWGNRSLLFLDPDGNLVNFFAPVTKEAIEKFGGR